MERIISISASWQTRAKIGRMNLAIVLHYLLTLGRTLLRFIGYGAGAAAGAGLVIIAIATRIGEDSPLTNVRFLEVVMSYAVLGAIAGAFVGLVYWLWSGRAGG